MTTSSKTLTLVKDPERLEVRLKEIPQEPGVYLMRDLGDRILYIGKAKKLRTRVRSYFRESQQLSDWQSHGQRRSHHYDGATSS